MYFSCKKIQKGDILWHLIDKWDRHRRKCIYKHNKIIRIGSGAGFKFPGGELGLGTSDIHRRMFHNFFGKVYYLTQSVHGKKKFRFGFRFFYLKTDILNVNPDVFTLSYSREKNESMEDGNIGDEARYKMCV